MKGLIVLGGEPYDSITTQTEALERRWDKMKILLVDTQHAVDINIETKKVRDELHALQDLMKTYEKWASSAEHSSDDAPDITRQLEQSKVSWKFKSFIKICVNVYSFSLYMNIHFLTAL